MYNIIFKLRNVHDHNSGEAAVPHCVMFFNEVSNTVATASDGSLLLITKPTISSSLEFHLPLILIA
jgi:hypothetical protein